MKLDQRFEEIQLDKDVVCAEPACRYTIIAGSIVHKNKETGKIYCTTCYHKMRSLD